MKNSYRNVIGLFLTVALISGSILMFGCKSSSSTALTIKGGELYFNETMIRPSDYAFNLPVITNKKIDKLPVLEVRGKNIDDITFTSELVYLDEYKSQYKYYLILKPKESNRIYSKTEDMSIESLVLGGEDGERIEYNIGLLSLKVKKDMGRGQDIIFMGSVVNLSKFQDGVRFEIKPDKDVVITKIYTTNKIKVDKVMESSGIKVVGEKILKDTSLDINLAVTPEGKLSNNTFNIGDILVEYKVDGESTTKYALAPVYFSIINNDSETFDYCINKQK